MVSAKKKFNFGHKQSRTLSEKVIFTVVFVLFSIYTLIMLYPFMYLILKSLQNSMDYKGVTWNNTGSSVPMFYFKSGLTPSNYWTALTGMTQQTANGDVNLLGMFFNSVWYTGAYIVGGVFASALTAYNLAKYKFPCSGLLYGIAIFSMTIPVIGTTGSMYKFISQIGIYDNPLFVLCTAPAGFGFQFLVLYGFFCNVSWSYAEAVFIDGGGHFTVFFKIMLPQAMPAMTTLGILSFISYWNNYEAVLMYLPSYPTLASGLYVLEQTYTDNRPAYLAGLVVMTVPVLALFAVFSNVIMSNMSVGGLKG